MMTFLFYVTCMSCVYVRSARAFVHSKNSIFPHHRGFSFLYAHFIFLVLMLYWLTACNDINIGMYAALLVTRPCFWGWTIWFIVVPPGNDILADFRRYVLLSSFCSRSCFIFSSNSVLSSGCLVKYLMIYWMHTLTKWYNENREKERRNQTMKEKKMYLRECDVNHEKSFYFHPVLGQKVLRDKF